MDLIVPPWLSESVKKELIKQGVIPERQEFLGPLDLRQESIKGTTQRILDMMNSPSPDPRWLATWGIGLLRLTTR